MRRMPTTVRFSEEELAALRRAAAADRRLPATLIRLIVLQWLEERGYIQPAQEGA
jgi:hypothetical protein